MTEKQKQTAEKCRSLYQYLESVYEIEIPATGLLAGNRSLRIPGIDYATLFAVDNMHFPLGSFYLKTGIPKIIQMAEETADTKGSEYAGGVAETYRLLLRFIEKHAEKAESMSKEALSGEEKERLCRIAGICRKLTEQAPETFTEALSLFWFVYLFRCPFGAGCIGRLDQYLYPFYEADVKAGRWKKEEALELVVSMFRKMNKNRAGDTLRNLMLSGQDEDGKDQTNELTYLFLDAYEQLSDAEPHLNVRIHANTPEELKQRVLTLLEQGGGQPTLYFDASIIPAMEQAGIPHAYACRYANDGCTETLIDGAGKIAFWQYEMVKTVELTVFNGAFNPYVKPVYMKKSGEKGPSYIPKTQLKDGFASGAMEEISSFEEFRDAFYRQLDWQLDRYTDRILKQMESDDADGFTSFLVGGTYEKCLRTGLDPLLGGGFEVSNYQLLSGTIPTAADCLRAVEYCVFEKKETMLCELRAAMAADFEGYEVLRQQLLHAPKYGNNETRADELAAELACHFLEKVNAVRGPRGQRIWPGLYNIDFKIFANVTGATPDGRKFRSPIAEHCSPTPGAAKKGPTSILLSAGKLPMNQGYASSPLHLTINKNGYEMGADRRKVISGLLSAAEKMQIPVLNLTMYSREELEDAQVHPECHRDLIVRVWGFNARFVELDGELQEHIIARIC